MSGNTTSPLHYDDYENLLCQIVGTKELVLFPPADIKSVAPLPLPPPCLVIT